MLRKEIQIALEAAAKISPHRHFVIAGSLSVLGFREVPPEMMSMSIDIDFFPLQDPGHVAEIAAALGEYSEFHETHGYYLDPISPGLPVLPVGWRDRMKEVKLGEVFAYFLDVHDIAISKYARSAENDFRWIDAGYMDGILSIGTIAARARFGTDYPADEDKQNVRRGIASHQATLLPDRTLDLQLLTYLRSDEVEDITLVDDGYGHYSGSIVWLGTDRAVQSQGSGRVTVHETQGWGQKLQMGCAYRIEYDDGNVTIVALDPSS
jgi:hypothetical protein